MRLERNDGPFETRVVRGSSGRFESGFETGVVLQSNPAFLVKSGILGTKWGSNPRPTLEGQRVGRCTAARKIRGGKTMVSQR